MDGWDLVVIVGVLLAFAPFSRRLAGSAITPAIVFTGAGVAFGSEALGVLDLSIRSDDLRLLAEATLTLVLFSDASSLDARRLRRQAALPLRLLVIALPLTIVLGTLVALPLLPELPLFAALALATLLAPTDAALGGTVVTDRRLPTILRQGLNTESGLNDGICVPILVAALALAELEELPEFDGEVLVDLVKEVSIALAVGVVVGAVVVGLFRFADRRRWMSDEWATIVPLATAVAAYAATAELGGSGFIGTFVAGLVYGRGLGARTSETTRLDEELGTVLSSATFLLFGAVMVGPTMGRLDVSIVVYGVLSLTVVRMLPVAVSLVGSGASARTMVFAGWFGPRGLATIVFALTLVEESGIEETRLVTDVATFVVLLSVVAHGISAPSLTDRYAGWLVRHGDRLSRTDQLGSDDIGPATAGARAEDPAGGAPGQEPLGHGSPPP